MASLCSILTFLILRTIHNFKQMIIGVFTGRTLKVWQCHNNSFTFSQSAQLLDIQHHCTAFKTPSRRNFVATHNGFVSPRYVRAPGRNVSLYCFENQLAVFVEWRHSAGDGFRTSLPKHGRRRALRLIVMSEDAFHQLGDLLEENSSTIHRVINTAHKAYRQCVQPLHTIEEANCY